MSFPFDLVPYVLCMLGGAAVGCAWMKHRMTPALPKTVAEAKSQAEKALASIAATAPGVVAGIVTGVENDIKKL